MTDEAIMAATSDHALIRHQNQRRIITSPIPDVKARMKLKIERTVSR